MGIMNLLSTGLGKLFGPWLQSFTLPALIISALIMAHGWKKEREAKIETAATQECNSSWLLAISKKKERAAVQQLEAAQNLVEVERTTATELRNDLEKIRTQHAALVERLGPGGDGRCLSDGMLDTLRKRYGVEPGSKGTKGR